MAIQLDRFAARLYRQSMLSAVEDGETAIEPERGPTATDDFRY